MRMKKELDTVITIRVRNRGLIRHHESALEVQGRSLQIQILGKASRKRGCWSSPGKAGTTAHPGPRDYSSERAGNEQNYGTWGGSRTTLRLPETPSSVISHDNPVRSIPQLSPSDSPCRPSEQWQCGTPGSNIIKNYKMVTTEHPPTMGPPKCRALCNCSGHIPMTPALLPGCKVQPFPLYATAFHLVVD